MKNVKSQQLDWNWGYIQEHPVRFSFGFTMAFSLLCWLFFSVVGSFIVYFLKSESVLTDEIVSLLVSNGMISVIGALGLTFSIWVRYGFRWHKIQIFGNSLSHPEDRVRQNATFELGRLFDPLAVPSLLRALQDPSAEVRAQAAVGLGDIADTRAVLPLLQALQERDAMVRGAAVQALGYMQDDRVVDPLIQSLSDPDNSVRSTAATVLGHPRHSRAITHLIHALHDNDALVRWHVVWALENMGEPSALPALFPLLHDPNISVREIATMAIRHLQDPALTRPKTPKIVARAFSYAGVTDKVE